MQQIPERTLEHTAPSEMVKGLQRIETILDFYHEYSNDPEIIEELMQGLNSRLNSAASQMKEISFYVEYGVSNYLNLAADSYLILDFLDKNESTKQSYKNSKVLEPGFSFDHITLKELVTDHMLPSVFSMLRATNNDFDKRFFDPLTSFLLTYSFKMSKIVGAEQEFKEMYRGRILKSIAL